MAVDAVIRDVDDNLIGAKVDQFSNHLITMGEVHARIHAGVFYSTSLIDGALVNTAALLILIRSHATQVAHLRVTAALGGDAQFEIFEAPTTSADGAALTPVNLNRITANTPDTLIFSGPTVSADGTPLLDTLIPGGGGPHASGGTGGNFAEYILAFGTDYLVRLTNISGNTQAASLQVDHYEP